MEDDTLGKIWHQLVSLHLESNIGGGVKRRVRMWYSNLLGGRGQKNEKAS